MKKSEQVSVPSKDGIRASSKTGDMITNKNKNNLKKKEESCKFISTCASYLHYIVINRT